MNIKRLSILLVILLPLTACLPSLSAAPTRSAATSSRIPSTAPVLTETSQANGTTTVGSWPEFNFDSAHSGDNPADQAIGMGNVSRLTLKYQVTLPGVADGAPVYLASVSTPDGMKNLLFMTTRDGALLAMDADRGALVWERQYPAGSCRINNGFQPCYTTSSPAIDPNGLYVYTYGLDGAVHKLQASDGTEITTAGWPEIATLKGYDEKGSSALAIATVGNGSHYLFVTNSGYLGDHGDYQGHLTAIDLETGTQQVFNSLCSDQPVHFGVAPAADCGEVQSGVWARAGVVYDPATDRIYAASGNGLFDPVHHDWGDTVFALNPDGTGVNGGPLDSYTPSDYDTLQQRDIDLGSTAPAILPVPAQSRIRQLGLQSGKDSQLRLLDLGNLSGQAGPGHASGEVAAPSPLPQGGQVLTAPAVWVNPDDQSTWIFIGNSRGLSGLRVNFDAAGNPSLESMWVNPGAVTSPIIVNGILYVAGQGSVQAVQPASGSVLWSSPQIGAIHWESPIVVNGSLYITDESQQLMVFSIGN